MKFTLDIMISIEFISIVLVKRLGTKYLLYSPTNKVLMGVYK